MNFISLNKGIFSNDAIEVAFDKIQTIGDYILLSSEIEAEEKAAQEAQEAKEKAKQEAAEEKARLKEEAQKEKEAAQALIAGGCKLISQHADSMGAPTACETAKVPNVSYNGSTVAACPNTFIVSCRIDWTPYFKYMIECVEKGEEIAADWTGTIETGSVVLTEVNEKAAAKDTAKKLEESEKKAARKSSK